jgi:hypothetical protein
VRRPKLPIEDAGQYRGTAPTPRGGAALSRDGRAYAASRDEDMIFSCAIMRILIAFSCHDLAKAQVAVAAIQRAPIVSSRR